MKIRIHTYAARLMAPIGALVLLGVAIPSPASAARVASAQPKSLALSLADVNHYFGSGWKVVTSAPVTQKTFALSLSSKTLPGGNASRHGFRSGYVASYNKTKNMTVFKNGKITFKPGIIGVTTGVYSFKDSSGPAWALTYAKAFARKKTTGIKTHSQSLSGIGNDALLQTTSVSMGSTLGSINGVSILWRHGSYMAIIALEGHGTVTKATALGVARFLDDRIGKSG